MAYKIKGELEVAKGLGLPNLTTVERTAYSPSREGYKVWDTDLNCEFNWTGLVWEKVGGFETVIVNAPATQQTIALDDPLSSSAFVITIQNNDAGFNFSGQTVIGDVDSDCYKANDSALVIPSVRDVPGVPILVTQPDSAPNTVTWVVAAGDIELRRGNNGGFYNIAAGQSSWSSPGPTDVEFRNDTNTTYDDLQGAYDGAIGDNITDPAYGNAYLRHIPSGDEYGPFTFVGWQDGGGGGFSVQTGIGPASIENVWNVTRMRPKVVKAQTTTTRNVEITNVTTTLITAGQFTGGTGGNQPLSISKFNNGFGGQTNHAPFMDQEFYFPSTLMNRIVIRSWTDVGYNVDMRVTISDPFGATQNITQSVGASNPSVNFDFNVQNVTTVKLEILSGDYWRSQGVNLQLTAPTIVSPIASGVMTEHDVLHLIAEENADDVPTYLDGFVGMSQIPAGNAANAVYDIDNNTWHTDPDWQAIINDSVSSRYAQTNRIGGANFDLQLTNPNDTAFWTVSSDGPAPTTVTYGTALAPQTIDIPYQESASFAYSDGNWGLIATTFIPPSGVQSGTFTMTSNIETVTFPADFGNTNYAFVATAVDNQAFFITQNASGKTSNSVSISAYDENGVNVQTTFEWIAIAF